MAKKELSADFTRVRQHNKALILNYLRTSGGSSRANLATHSGLTRATASSLVNELIEQGWVYDVGLQESSGGRPGTRVELNPQAGCAIGIEIQNDFISVILADFVARVRWCERIPLDDYSLPSALSRAEILIEEALHRGQKEGLSPFGIAVGLPGMVDTHQGVLVFAPNLGWKDVPIRDILMERFKVPVYVHNEATMTALGESYFGAARGCPNFIYVDTAMRGIGTGMMFDGRLFLGSNGYAGEAGHMLIQLDGKPCACGRRGCWETLVSGQAVLDRTAELLARGESSLLTRRDSPLTLEALSRAAKQKDPLACRVLEETSRLLAVGLANLVNIFNPQLIVLGGVLSRIIEPYLETITQAVKSEALYPLADATTVKLSSMGVDTCVMGAVATVLDEINRPWFNGDR